MAEADNTAQQVRPRSNFASRMLNKELTTRNKTTQQMKISPADAAKYANTAEEQSKQEATVG
jgi:hypothetical protein